MPPTNTSAAQALDIADARHWTRRPPTRPHARVRHLLRTQPASLLAPRLFCSPQALARWADSDTDDLTPVNATLIERETYRTWQPQVRRRAHQQILEHDGCVTVQLHARFSFTTASGEFHDPRLRRLTEDLPTLHARRLFDAHHEDADEEDLRRILADGIGEAYFFRALRPDQQQAAATITDLHHIQFHY
ncbi:telomere-protecting terminal protein Tpg [Streptomyces sp. NPDC047886]|uniref:telomere-protecting terminal protein Tpg n=1 Tax=Streptomyces sp. NPDC047886 TaxID=3365490 RepID=UPI003715ABFF